MCQPDPDRPPPSNEFRPASSSRCIGCGSNSLAKAMISSRVTRRGPRVMKWPGLKSSNVSMLERRLWAGNCGYFEPIVAVIIEEDTAGGQIRIHVHGAQARADIDYRAKFARETIMFEWRDLFQWDRFITPSIIKV